MPYAPFPLGGRERPKPPFPDLWDGANERSPDAEVVALGAWCDLVPPEEARQRPPGGVSFCVVEFAVLADGRRAIIRDDLGWGGHSYRLEDGKTQMVDPWLSLTRERIVQDVRNVVLPDDDDSPDEHPYEWLRELLLHQGVDATVEQLRSLPYTVELSDRLERRLSDKEPPAAG